MKKQFAVKALKRIIQIQKRHRIAKRLGIDLIELDNGVELLEESIATLFTKKDKDFELALNDVQWWLYENVDKIITLQDKTKLDVTTPESFIDWLEDWYK